MYIKRHLEKEILSASEGYPVVMVTGSRQVGKTTLLKQLAGDNRAFVSLDDMSQRLLAQNQPQLFLQNHTPPLIIDEIQYAPELFTYIKIAVDENNKNGQFWLTGSQIFPLMQGVQETLAGRVRLLQLSGLSQSELNGTENLIFPPTIEDLFKRSKEIKDDEKILTKIIRGGYPRLLTQPAITVEGFYNSYLQTYIARDVREITNVMDTSKFLQFVALLATRTAQELNLAGLSRDLMIDSTTVRRWLNVLEISGIVVSLPSFSKNPSRRVVKRPKIYFIDTGLVCQLLGIEDEEGLSNTPLRGSIFETWVVSEVYKSWWNDGRLPRLSYYRDSSQKEIDLMIDRNGKLYPFGIKINFNAAHAFKNFSVLDSIGVPLGYGGLLHSGDEIVPTRENCWLIPSRLI
ncbi:MAG: ATP-binding protein [Anaerolineaceae bacterium]|jgi:hypothetical protein|nr:ATP-binding protein [Anaerolineaceae bacterium]MDD4042778.1 ATP-binding protein [Anaerolineaceae bacterium]MDD4577375.1 ATP-binding protein [Anaerolineaceae bacterium]